MQSELFNLDDAVAMLERTPATLNSLLTGLPEAWMRATEGDGSWSAYDVVGHLIHDERTNWIPRARHIMAGAGQPFPPFDRSAQFAEGQDTNLAELLATFAELRRANLEALRSMSLEAADLGRTGLHPELGQVRLDQLLSAWVVHDLNHTAQIVRTLAKVYTEAVGPWSRYLLILQHE